MNTSSIKVNSEFRKTVLRRERDPSYGNDRKYNKGTSEFRGVLQNGDNIIQSNRRPKDRVNLLRVLWAVATKTSMSGGVKRNENGEREREREREVSFYRGERCDVL